MAKKKKKQKNKQRDEPLITRAVFSDFAFTNSCSHLRGYNSLSETPEIKAGIEKIAEIISTMTIHLMKNGEFGDERLKNGLSKKIDINPNLNMTRQLFISWIVQEMMLKGNAVVIPNTKDGILIDLKPIPKSAYDFIKLDNDYQIRFEKGQIKSSNEILNFRYNPDLGHPWIGKSQEIILSDLMENLKQANATVSEFMKNKMFPSVVVKVDALTNELANKEGREKIEEQFLTRNEAGKPWIIPANLIDVKEIKPLTLQDIAIHESMKINKQTVASILGMPAFLLGVGEYNKEEYNNFIRTKIAVICKAIEQELTEKLIISNEMYFQFNRKSMLNYDLQELGGLYMALYEKGIVTGNEVRDVLGMSPRAELDKLIILENYIPAEKIGDQKKLGGEENSEE